MTSLIQVVVIATNWQIHIATFFLHCWRQCASECQLLGIASWERDMMHSCLACKPSTGTWLTTGGLNGPLAWSGRSLKFLNYTASQETNTIQKVRCWQLICKICIQSLLQATMILILYIALGSHFVWETCWSLNKQIQPTFLPCSLQ